MTARAVRETERSKVKNELIPSYPDYIESPKASDTYWQSQLDFS
ncbi:hypothetical protein [Pseudanabaena sp. PCC 6802]|nr:hypothetical protein [Pseudanabaena sp. PCC 6802]